MKKEKINKVFNTTSIVFGIIILLIGITIGILISSHSSFAIDTSNLKYGDLDCDGSVTSADLVTVARATAGIINLTEQQKIVADVNLDGKVDKEDEYILAKYVSNYEGITLPYVGTTTEIKYGDVDLNGSITSSDGVLLARYLENKESLTDKQKLNADVNLDGKIDDCDKKALAEYLSGKGNLPSIEMATPSNATASNATSSNATSANASTNDNVLYLHKIQFIDEKEEYKAGDNIKIEISTSGACNTSGNIYIIGKNKGKKYTLNVKTINNEKIITIPEDIISDEYIINEALLFGLNSNNTEFSKQFKNTEGTINSSVLIIKNETKKSEIPLELYDFDLESKEVKIGETLKITFKASEPLYGMTLKFKSEKGNEFSADISKYYTNYDPKFMIPSNVMPDDYVISSITIINAQDSVTYTKGDNLKFDIKLTIKDTNKKVYSYLNKEIDERILNEIYNYKEGSTINIDANDNSIISAELFNVLKGTSKDLVIEYQGNKITFCGKNISNPKSIDVSMTIDKIKENDELLEYVDEGIIINLSSNGNLPGKATYKIYATEEIKESLGNKNIYLYYYDETNKNFNLIQTNVKLNDNYYELNINHNSKYILTKKKIESQYVVKESNNIVDFQNNNTTNILLIIGGIILILVVLIIIILLKRSRNLQKNKGI